MGQSNNIIKNKAKIIYNETQVKETQEITTVIEPNLDVEKKAFTQKSGLVHKDTLPEPKGIIDAEDGTVTYEVLLKNHSSKEIDLIEIEDTITLKKSDYTIVDKFPDGYTFKSVEDGENQSKIIITPPEGTKLAPNSVQSVWYTLIIKDETIGTEGIKGIKNSAKVKSRVEEQEYLAETNLITMDVEYSATLYAWKSAPESVICNQIFNYTINLNPHNLTLNQFTIEDVLSPELIVYKGADGIKVRRGFFKSDDDNETIFENEVESHNLTISLSIDEYKAQSTVSVSCSDTSDVGLAEGEGIQVIIPVYKKCKED